MFNIEIIIKKIIFFYFQIQRLQSSNRLLLGTIITSTPEKKKYIKLRNSNIKRKY